MPVEAEVMSRGTTFFTGECWVAGGGQVDGTGHYILHG